MKKKVSITRKGETLYSGKLINIKIKEDAVIQKSIELFDDDEPCIIHQSYVYKEYANDLLQLLKKERKKTIQVKDFLDELSFLDYENLEDIEITVS